MAATAKNPQTRNLRDSMKSTWRNDKDQWGFFHYAYEILNIHPSYVNKHAPVHKKSDPVPVVPAWTTNRLALTHALIPIVIHQAYVYYTHKNLSIWAVLALYTLSFKAGGIHQIQQLRALGAKWGFFDGDAHPRDEVPDHSVARVFFSLINTSNFRSIITVFLAYNIKETPMDVNWKWLVVEMGLYGIILDFWFYWYHRVMHEFDSLWRYHRTHHLTKHPNPLLALYADTEQEIFDIAGIPLMTYFTMRFMGMPMGFYEWWICHQLVMFAELSGHSGLRVYATPPNPFAFILRFFRCELVIEDHDLHHRQGWKTSGNYGKQTRLWDRVFGTLIDRVECAEENVDWNTSAYHPLL